MKTRILIPLLTLACLLAGPATAQVNYAVDGGAAYVAASPNVSGNIVIASNYNGYPVTAVADEAFRRCANLTSVTIPNTVSTIGFYAFSECTSLTNVTIPNSVTLIYSAAFNYCTSLRNVTLPSVDSIKGETFRDCTSLTDVTIPNLHILGDRAFFNCSSLTKLTIPGDLIAIGDDALSGLTSLTNITVGGTNGNYSSVDGVLFNNTQTVLIQYPAGRGGSYVIPNSVISIALGAFSRCSSLTSATIPNSVANIGPGAFSFCASLTNVAIGSGVTSIASDAFSSCPNLIGFSVDAGNAVYSSLDGVWFNKAQTTLIQYPAGRGGSYVMPNNVTNIAASAFEGCTNLSSVMIGNSVIRVGDHAFQSCTSLTNITVPNNVTDIGWYAFQDCNGLRSITLGSGITDIGYGIFQYCTSLTNITVSVANLAYSSIGGVLFDKAQSTLLQFPIGRGGSYTIPGGITTVAYSAFDSSANLTSVAIPGSVTNFASPFYDCNSLTNISVDAANPVYCSLDGVFFDKPQTTLIRMPGGRAGSYLIPDTVTDIGFLSFYNCSGLTRVTIPTSVTNIEGDAFYSCTNLTNLTFLGNAPDLYNDFNSVGPGATVFYHYGTTGWGQMYGYLPTVMLGAPAPQIGTGSTGVKPGGYGFTVAGVVNQTMVVEASTNLVNWQPIWTNTLSDVSTDFVDPQWLNFPRRFYRLRSY